MTLEPMLRLVAGIVVTGSVLLGTLVHPGFFWVTGFVGVNLVQSAFTGWCPMMAILRKGGVRDNRPRQDPVLQPSVPRGEFPTGGEMSVELLATNLDSCAQPPDPCGTKVAQRLAV